MKRLLKIDEFEWCIHNFNCHTMETNSSPSNTSIAPICENLDERNTEMFLKDIEKKGDADTRAIHPPIGSPQNLIAAENYSVFTVKQKRIMIATVSFASWIR